MANKTHHYDTLDEPSQQIRLVRLLPRGRKKQIQVQLTVVSLNEVQGNYEAISYMWGSETPMRHIFINGERFRVRDNIWQCLKHLRDNALTDSRLWIDTISINQNDAAEKSQQVATMSQIFKCASRVLIWLGSVSMQTYLISPGQVSTKASIVDLPPNDLDRWVDAIGQSDSMSWSVENQIMSIAYNPYWRRLWIIQEVARARKACLIFGRSLLGESYIHRIYNTARENSKPGFHSWISKQTDPNIKETGTSLLDHHPMLRVRREDSENENLDTSDSFTELIKSYHWQSCSDPRDYVYGLVGLLQSPPGFTVDYTSSCEKVALDALKLLNDEGAEDFGTQACLNLQAGAALLKALSVTGYSYLRFKQSLPRSGDGDREEAIFRIRLLPLAILDPVASNEDLDNLTYDDVYRVPVTGHVNKSFYRMRRSDNLSLKTSDGIIKRFSYFATRASESRLQSDGFVQLISEARPVFCFLGNSSGLVVRRSSTDIDRVVVEHFIRPDLTSSILEESPWLEEQLPGNVRHVLEEHITTHGLQWTPLSGSEPSRAILHFTFPELVSLCELIRPKASDVDEFQKNKLRYR